MNNEKEEIFVFTPDMCQPMFTEKKHIFKSLFPDVLPSASLIVKIDEPGENDALCNLILHAAYEAYRKEMQRRLIEKHGSDAVGTWHSIPDPEIRE